MEHSGFCSRSQFAINRNILWKAMVDPMASLPIPTTQGLINTNHVGQRKEICSLIVEVCD
jgi:hypothetical protein